MAQALCWHLFLALFLARLQRVGVEGDYFVLVIIDVVLFIGVRRSASS